MQARAALASAKSEVCRLTSNINGVREWSEGYRPNQNAATDRYEAVEGIKMERSKAEKICNSLVEAERKSSGIIDELQEILEGQG